jgi:hypothetical protein
MTLFDALYSKLTGTAAVTAIVGATGVYPVTIGQGVAAPYVIFSGLGSVPDQSHTGASDAVMRMVQFACFAPTFEQAAALRAAVVAALDGVALDNGDVGTLDDDNRDDFDDAANLYRCDADMTF